MLLFVTYFLCRGIEFPLVFTETKSYPAKLCCILLVFVAAEVFCILLVLVAAEVSCILLVFVADEVFCFFIYFRGGYFLLHFA